MNTPADDAATQAAEKIHRFYCKPEWCLKDDIHYTAPIIRTALTSATAEAEREIKWLKVDCSLLRSANGGLADEVNRLSGEHDRASEIEQIPQLRSDLATALQRLTALESENAQLTGEVENLANDNVQLCDKLDELNNKNAAQAEALRVKDKALTECIECAAAIHRNIDDEVWTETQDPLWVPTIHAHATVIWQDARQALSTAPATAAKAKETL